MIFIYFLIAGSTCSIACAVFDICRVLQHQGVAPSDPDLPPPANTRVKLPSQPPSGSGTAFARPEVEGSAFSHVP